VHRDGGEAADHAVRLHGDPRGGNFVAENAFNPIASTSYREAIVGGTGTYAGAHGQFLAQPAPGRAERWTITYTR
jgi:hypothetical protein